MREHRDMRGCVYDMSGVCVSLMLSVNVGLPVGCAWSLGKWSCCCQEPSFFSSNPRLEYIRSEWGRCCVRVSG